jgi:hypothetical protein
MADSMHRDLPEVSGGQDEPGHPVTVEGPHRNPLTVHDPDGGGDPTTRDAQVDSTAIEYLDGATPMYPHSLAGEAAAGGYAAPGDQSYPESPPRAIAGTRGAQDIGGIPGEPRDFFVFRGPIRDEPQGD